MKYAADTALVIHANPEKIRRVLDKLTRDEQLTDGELVIADELEELGKFLRTCNPAYRLVGNDLTQTATKLRDIQRARDRAW